GEALLFDGKLTNRLGSVDDDTSNLSYEPEEHRRKITISPKLGYCEWKKVKVNFIDTPGDTNFFVETKLAMSVSDAAVVVVSAPDGVQVGTEAVWRYADEMELPRLVFVSKMDRERADFDQALSDVPMVLSEEEISRVLKKAIALRSVIPVVCGSAGRNLGLQPLLDTIVMGVPSPAELPAKTGTDPKTKGEIERKCADTEPFSAIVWK